MQHASLGEENAILPHDTSPCETGFLLHKETVPHFSCRLILILQTLTRGRGAGSCQMAAAGDEVPAAVGRAWWHLHLRELLAA